jgi:hypothetical protein
MGIDWAHPFGTDIYSKTTYKVTARLGKLKK